MVQEFCGGLLLPREGDQLTPAVVIPQPKDGREFDCRMHCPDKVNKHRFRELTTAVNDQLVESWMRRPLLALDGKSAIDASKDPALKRKVAACVLALQANAMYFDRPVRIEDVRKKLGVADGSRINLASGQHCASFSAFSLQRIEPQQLNDAQIQEYCNRCSMLGFVDLARQGLDELLRRSDALSQFGVVRASLMRASIARSDNDLNVLATCLQTAREAASQSKDSFRELLEIEIRELAMRLDDPEDPALVELLHRIRDRYVSKLPEIATVIASQLIESDCEHLIAELESPLAVGAESGGALWTPGAASESSGAGGSLWLPGQE